MAWYADERFTLSSDSGDSRNSLSGRSPHRSPLIMLPLVSGPLDIPQWSSRALSLKDRFRYESPQGCVRAIMARVFKTLLGLCINDKAVKSFRAFETAYYARGGSSLFCRLKSNCASCLQLRSAGIPVVVVTQHTDSEPTATPLATLPAITNKPSVMEAPVGLSGQPRNATRDTASLRSLSITTASNSVSSISGCSSLSGRSSPAGSNSGNIPRYMSPTIASVSQASCSSATGMGSRNTTPTEGSTPHNMTKPRKWFTTGMSLASVGRSADGTPRGKKEGPAGCSGNQAGDYPPLDKAQLERSSKTFPSGIRHFDLCKSLPTEKPLPSPPVGQIITTGVPAVQRGLLDAADLPLRRSTSSEAGEPGMIEEWPILLPQATSRVNSIQQEDSSTSESPFTGVRLTGLESTPNSVNSSPPQVAATTGAASDGTANRQAVAAAQVQRKLIPRPTQQALNGMKPLSGVSGNVGNLAPRIRASDKPSKLPMKSTTGTENQTVKPAEKKEIRNVRKAELPSGRPSSIPISRKANSPPGSSLESESGVVLSARQMKTARNCIALFEDEQVAGDADVDTDDVVSPAGVKVPNTEGLATLEARSSHGVKAATSRSSHNAHNTRIGTPSKNLPRFGPTLRISSAANSIIMGPAEESGSSSSGKKTSPTLHRAVITKELQKSSTYFNRHFDIKQGAQQTVASGEASAKRSQPRPKSADGDITRMCGLITVRGQKSWSMDAIRLILKGESDIVEGEPQRDDPFIEFQHALKEKADDDTGAQAALKGDDPSPKLAESTDEEKSVQTIGVTRSAISTTKIHVPTSFKSKIPSAQRGPSTGVTLPNNRPKGSRVAHRPQFTPLQRPPSSANSFSSDRPPRSSSRVAVPDFTIASSKVAGSASKRNQPRPAPKGATETQALKDPATVQNLLGPSSGTESTPPKISPSADAKPDSDTSKVSQTPSTKMLAITKIRGLFRKNTSPTSKKPAPKGGKKFTVNNDGSPLASPATGRASAGKPWSRIGRVSRPPGTPPPAKPTINSFPTPGPTPSRPSESAEINALAMSLLNSARDEPNSPRKEHLLALGRAMVESITNARDAEKAMEEAKMAARSAEVYYMKAKQSVLCVTNVVREWQDSEGGANLI